MIPSSDTRSRLAAASLYAITAEGEPARVLELAAAYLRGGAGLLQLRHKSMARGALLQLARDLAEECHRLGALLIVNDHLDIAMLCGADGVHLGAGDLSLESARRAGGRGLLIGASASTPESARAAVAAGADYIGCGPAFATPIKAARPPIGPARVAAVAAAVEVPLFAIGGIGPHNVGELVAAGIRRVCVIRALAEAHDPEACARDLRAALAR